MPVTKINHKGRAGSHAHAVHTAITLSALTSKPLTIHSIHEGGLEAAQLASVKALTEISHSTVEGAEIGSASLSFYPPTTGLPPVKQEYDTKLEGSERVALVFQTLYPCLLRGGGLTGADVVQLNITGDTNVASSPSFDYIKQVFVPNLEKLGFPPLLVELQKRGWTIGPAE